MVLDQAVELIIDHRGRTPKKLGGDFGADGVQVVSAKNVFDGRLHLGVSQRFVPTEMAARWMPIPLRLGDVLLTSEAPLGEVAYLDGTTNLCLGQRLFALRARRNITDSRFLYYTLLSPAVQGRLHARASGTTAQGIKQSELRKVEVELPPLAQQQRIAAVLGALDGKINSNRRLRNTCDQTAAELFRASVARQTDERTSIGKLIEEQLLYISDGFRAKNAELAAEGLPFARAGNLNDGFDFTNVDRLPESLARVVRAKCSSPGDVVFTSKGTVGRFALVDLWIEPFVYSPQLCFWRSLDHGRLPPVVLFWWLQGAEAKRQLDALKGQTDMADYVSLRDQRSMTISLPPSDAIRELAAALDPLSMLSGSLRAESRTLCELRDALLPKLISGQIRVPDSADPAEVIEPAAEVLRAAAS